MQPLSPVSSEVDPVMLGEKVTRANQFPHTCLFYTQVQRYPPLWQLHSGFGDFTNRVCHVMKIIIGESNPDY